MPQTFTVTVPENMSSKTVAEIFSAYRLGDVAFQNKDGSMEPLIVDHGADHDRWQLDRSDDFWVTVDKKEGKAELSCRYLHEEQIIEAIVVLFDVVYNSE